MTQTIRDDFTSLTLAVFDCSRGLSGGELWAVTGLGPVCYPEC